MLPSSRVVSRAVIVVALVAGGDARAQPTARAEAVAGAWVRDGGGHRIDIDVAAGAAAGVGWWYALSTDVIVGPEVDVSFVKVSDALGRNIIRGAVGPRLRWTLSRTIAFASYLHAGYGHTWGRDDDVVLSLSGIVIDTGVTLDFALGKRAVIGPEIVAGAMLATPTGVAHWGLGGARLAVVWDAAGSPKGAGPSTRRD